jgi:hypothetical protein
MASHLDEGPERRGIVAASHGDEQAGIICKLLGQLLWCGGVEINANLLHDGKNFWMHAQSWLGACRHSFSFGTVGKLVRMQRRSLGLANAFYISYVIRSK